MINYSHDLEVTLMSPLFFLPFFRAFLTATRKKKKKMFLLREKSNARKVELASRYRASGGTVIWKSDLSLIGASPRGCATWFSATFEIGQLIREGRYILCNGTPCGNTNLAVNHSLSCHDSIVKILLSVLSSRGILPVSWFNVSFSCFSREEQHDDSSIASRSSKLSFLRAETRYLKSTIW